MAEDQVEDAWGKEALVYTAELGEEECWEPRLEGKWAVSLPLSFSLSLMRWKVKHIDSRG